MEQLLRGMRLSHKKPAKCLKEFHSPTLQEANTHWLLIKLFWLMDKYAASADRDVKQGQLWGNAEEATTVTVAFSMDRGPLDMLIVQAVKTDAVLPEDHTHHVTSENGWAITATTILQFTATLDKVLNLSKELQAWILLWDTASIHASEGTMTAMKEKFTSYCASSRHEAPRHSIPVTSSSPSTSSRSPLQKTLWTGPR